MPTSNSNRHGSDLTRQGSLISEISGLIPTEVTGPWCKLTFNRRSLSMLAEHELIVERPGGIIDESEGVPFEVDDLLDELRKVMYTPGAGTWMSAQWTVTDLSDGHAGVRSTFNYDDEPSWQEPLDPGMYGLDLEEFPRDPQNTPMWMQQRLDEARRQAN